MSMAVVNEVKLMTDIKIIKLIEQGCIKNGDISVQNVKRDGTFQLVIPVYVGDDEFEPEQIATLDLEYFIDAEDDNEWVEIYHFPFGLLSDEEYNLTCEMIMDILDLS